MLTVVLDIDRVADTRLMNASQVLPRFCDVSFDGSVSHTFTVLQRGIVKALSHEGQSVDDALLAVGAS